MKKYLVIIAFLLGGLSNIRAQQHYIVQWDRINNEVSYIEVNFQNGKRKEEKIKKPFLKEGDVLEGRIINVNEFIYQPVVKVNRKTLSEKNSNRFIGNVLGGLGLLDLGTGLFGAISKINTIANNQEAISLGNRGESVEDAQAQLILNWERTLVADIVSINYELSQIQMATNEIENLNKLIHSEELNLTDFKVKASESIQNIKNMDLGNTLKKLSASTEEIKQILTTAENQGIVEEISQELKSNCNEVIASCASLNFTKLNSALNEEQIHTIESMIADADFAYSNKYLVEEIQGEYGVAVENSQYDIDFQIYKRAESDVINLINENMPLAEDSESDNTYNALVTHKLVHVNSESPLKPSWTTGFTFHMPFAKQNFIQSSYNYNRDTVSFFKGKSIPSGLAIATQLMFELGNYEKFIPNFSLGVSYKINEFLKDDNSFGNQSEFSNMSVLLGGGLRTRGFQYFSLNTGISWSQIQVLNSSLMLNTDYNIETLVQSDMGVNYFENRWYAGLFIGVGFHF
jgi:hypothetical protein